MWLGDTEFNARLGQIGINLTKRTLQLYRERRLINVRRDPMNKRLIQYHSSDIERVRKIRELLADGKTLTAIKEYFDSQRPQNYTGRKEVIDSLGLTFSGQNYSVWYSETEDTVIVTVFENFTVICFKTEQFDVFNPPDRIDIIETVELDWDEFHERIGGGGHFNTNSLFDH